MVGGGGQLADAVVRRFSCNVLSRSDLDITSRKDVLRVIGDQKPPVVVNAAAYTAVDRAESDPVRAFAVNRDGVRNLAEACLKTDARLIHVSTDFVFDGTASAPIPADAATRPLSVYGQSKLEGELACREVLGDKALIVRTAWVYAAGHPNFVTTMLRLMQERDELGVVADQVGTPTWAETLAQGILDLVELGAHGVHHLTDAGVASWYDFAVAIEELGRACSLLDRPCRIRPIRTADYPTPATRPSYGVLDKTATFNALGRVTPHWRESLGTCLAHWTAAA